jgi:hypothetical protein
LLATSEESEEFVRRFLVALALSSSLLGFSLRGGSVRNVRILMPTDFDTLFALAQTLRSKMATCLPVFTAAFFPNGSFSSILASQQILPRVTFDCFRFRVSLG